MPTRIYRGGGFPLFPCKIQARSLGQRADSSHPTPHSLPHAGSHREGKEEDPRYQPAMPYPLVPEAWKKELKNLASRVAVFTKESELKSKKVGAERRSCLGRDEKGLSLCNKCSPKWVPPNGQ